MKFSSFVSKNKLTTSYFNQNSNKVNFFLRGVNYDLSSIFNSKESLTTYRVFVSISGNNHFVGYRHKSHSLSLLNNIHFFNPSKSIALLSQFSRFFYKVVLLRGQILLVDLSKENSKSIQDISYFTGQYYLTGGWVSGLWSNWSYFYKKLWELENILLWQISKKKIISFPKYLNRYLGLLGLRNFPDFIFVFNNANLFSYSNLVKESYSFGIPIGGVVSVGSDDRFISFPLLSDQSNFLSSSFYKLIYIKLYKLGLLKRYFNSLVY